MQGQKAVAPGNVSTATPCLMHSRTNKNGIRKAVYQHLKLMPQIYWIQSSQQSAQLFYVRCAHGKNAMVFQFEK